jgi:hypothetical protein
MLKYNDAMLLFSSAKDKKKGRLLEVNTRLNKAKSDDFVITFNKTIIIKILKDNTYILYNQGKHHPAILRKINKYTPACLKIKKNKWVLKDNFKFFNGVIITPTGELKIPEPHKKYEKFECRKCGLHNAVCKCPLSKAAYDKAKQDALHYKENYGYVPTSMRELLARGVEKDD